MGDTGPTMNMPVPNLRCQAQIFKYDFGGGDIGGKFFCERVACKKHIGPLTLLQDLLPSWRGVHFCK